MKRKDGRIEIELNVGMTTNDNNTVFSMKKNNNKIGHSSRSSSI